MSQRPRPFDDADLHAYVDGQMDLARRTSFIQALAADPELRAKAEIWKRQNQALTNTFGPVLSEQVPVRLMPKSLVRRGGSPALVQGSKPASSPPSRASLDDGHAAHAPARTVAVAAGTFLLGVACSIGAGGFGWSLGVFASKPAIGSALQSDGRNLAIRAYEAHQTYVTDLNRPVEVPASDQVHLVKWIQHRLAMPIRIPSLSPQGWTLLGGRILPGEVGPAAFLVYGNGVERLGLYMGRTNMHQSDSYRVYDNGAGLASVAYWVDEPIGYALTTSRGSTWLSKNGQALYQSVRAQARDNASAF